MAEPGQNTDGTSTATSPFTAEQLAMITEFVQAGVVAGLASSHGPAATDGGPLGAEEGLKQPRLFPLIKVSYSRQWEQACTN